MDEAGVAKIKEEFVVKRAPREAKKKPEVAGTEEPTDGAVKRKAEGDDETATEPACADACGDEEQAREPEGKKIRGQNKKRKPAKHDQDRTFCRSFVRNGKCTFGEGCKYSHDMEQFARTREPDLGGLCPFVRLSSTCEFGAACRFAASHPPIDASAPAIGTSTRGESKGPSGEIRHALQRRTYAFPKFDEFTKLFPPNAAKSTTTAEASDHVTTDEQAAGDAAVTEQPAVEAVAVEQVESTTVADEIVVPLPEPSVGSIVLPEKHYKKNVSFRDCLYLAPLTTVGNLPFRRVCKQLGADITCGEMALALNLLQGQQSEWALLKRHESEDVFGIQVCGSSVDVMIKTAELINATADVDFVDINSGCPIDLVFKSGAGSALMPRTAKFQRIVQGMSYVLDVPLSVKIRTGVMSRDPIAHKLIPKLYSWGASAVTLHGRSREQRYSKLADWAYIGTCAEAAHGRPFLGNGDIYSFDEALEHRAMTGVTGLMISRGALIKPWLFKEIKEERHWDISAQERLEIMKDYVKFGLEHWGSDTEGVEKTRRFLLEWMSFTCRYIPVGILERVPHRMNERPPMFIGRNDLETLLASSYCDDWVKITEMILAPRPANFVFVPKHKANAYAQDAQG